MSTETIITLLFELANFIGLAAVLGWLFFRPVRNAIAEHNSRLQSMDAAAAHRLAEAEAMRSEVAERHRDLDVELEGRRKASHERAQKEASELIAAAEAAIDRERQALREHAADLQRAQIAKTASTVASVAGQTVAALLNQLAGAELDELLADAACTQLTSLSSQPQGTITIETSSELTDKSKQRLESLVRELNCTVQYQTVPALQGGLRIQTSEGLVDASISGMSRFAEEKLSAEIENSLRGGTTADPESATAMQEIPCE